MTKTLRHELRDVAAQHGYALGGGPDQVVLSPPYAKWWGCLYQPKTGEIAALVTRAPLRTVKRQLLQLVNQPPPKPVSERRGRIVAEGGSLLTVTFDEATRVLHRPIFVPLVIGDPVIELQFDDHLGPVMLWGPQHMPRRLTQTPFE